MGRLLISKVSVAENKILKENQKEYLKQHRQVKGRYPKGKLGKVVKMENEACIECVEKTIRSGRKADNGKRDLGEVRKC